MSDGTVAATLLVAIFFLLSLLCFIDSVMCRKELKRLKALRTEFLNSDAVDKRLTMLATNLHAQFLAEIHEQQLLASERRSPFSIVEAEKRAELAHEKVQRAKKHFWDAVGLAKSEGFNVPMHYHELLPNDVVKEEVSGNDGVVSLSY